MNILLCISYDGTEYHGFQSQSDCITVQDTIEKALHKVYDVPIRIIGSGRTDSGVHAEKSYANFYVTHNHIPAEKISVVLNSYLPDDIVVLYSKEVEETFHARYSAIQRCYYYQFYRGRQVPAIYRLYALGVDAALDFHAMEDEAQGLLGTHDFRSFTVHADTQQNTVRTIYNIHMSYSHDTNIIRLYISANAFLWKMIRSIVGTLLQNAYYRKLSKSIEYVVKDILQARDNSLCATVVAAKGLCLCEVEYATLKKE